MDVSIRETNTPGTMSLPTLPAPLHGFIPHLHESLASGSSPLQATNPYKEYEAKLRELFAQEPNNPALTTPDVNLVPLFAGHENLLSTHARRLDQESSQERDSYILPLDDKWRKPHGSPAIVQSMQQFRKNFSLFSETSLADLDWSNVVAAGSSVITPLLPVPEKHNATKKDLRRYYHEKLAPASDVDLFLYGLNEEQAIEKIKQIEACIKNSILEEVTSVRTKNTITIVSKYPVRHVQIVLRLYKNISEILTGFDVDCACVAYDGSQVWATPRAVTALVTQTNTIDLTRRSPSYENRLAKYRHRGFEVYWPDIDRSKIDPTIFERSFSHVLGLARLLVTEKLPTQPEREEYLDQRKTERGAPRPSANRYSSQNMGGKFRDPAEVAEWVEAEDVSNYHSLTIPYGPNYHAKKIEKILYKKDLLLNAEWNKSKKRNVNLHRHPAFFGSVEHIVKDCCPSCPVPLAQEDIEVAKEESKWFISGDMTFIKDDPGRQAIGSFNPITDTDWTEMAYISDTARLSQAIVDGDLDYVKNWCSQEGIEGRIDTRDHTGRTPLHLATICGNVEIVKCLIDHGARIVARIVGGLTALHIAAYRGHVGIIKALLEKSEANRSEIENKEPTRDSDHSSSSSDEESSETDELSSGEDDGDTFIVSEGETDVRDATTEASFVNIQTVKEPKKKVQEEKDGVETNDPDIYDINVLAWDVPVSPLHLGIMHGHTDVIDTLVSSFGADALLPAWFPDLWGEGQHATLPLALPLSLPAWQSLAVCKILLELGVSSAQADPNHITSLHAIVANGTPEHLDLLFDLDQAAAKCAINHPAVVMEYGRANCDTPMIHAIRRCDMEMVSRLFKYGKDFEVPRRMMSRICAAMAAGHRYYHPKPTYTHPAIAAVTSTPEIADLFIKTADPNALDNEAQNSVIAQDKGYYWEKKRSLLDYVDRAIGVLKPKFESLQEDHVYLDSLREGSYIQWLSNRDLEVAKMAIRSVESRYKSGFEDRTQKGLTDDDVNSLKTNFAKTLDQLRKLLVSKGAQHFHQMHPNLVTQDPDDDAPAPFSLNHKFVSETEEELEQKAYLKLFEAVWEGDEETVKKITTAPWGEDRESPLLVSVRNHCKLSALDIAIGCGNTRMIKLIMDIANIQYKPPTKQHSAHRTVNESSDDDDSDGSSMSGVEYDNKDMVDVRDTAEIIPSYVHPVKLLRTSSQLWRFLESWKSHAEDIFKARKEIAYDADQLANALSEELQAVNGPGYTSFRYPGPSNWSPLKFAIEKGDTQLASLILDLGNKYSTTDPKGDDDEKFAVTDEEFELALRHGRIEILTAIILKTGHGLPLQKLRKQAGAKLEVESKYYSGLLVNGKPMKKWSDQHGSDDMTASESMESPVLQAIYKGSLETVKWFLSGEPLVKYKEYLLTHKHNDAFENVDGGYEKVLSSWWNSKRDCALFYAVMAKPASEVGINKLKITLDAVPEALNHRAFDGITPLHMAFSLHRISAARYLIQRGADQQARDNKGRNILHYLLSIASNGAERPKSFKVFQALWDLIDPAVAATLATQRTKSGTTFGMDLSTPLMHLTKDSCIPEIPRYVLQKTNGAGLRIMNDQGDYPIHAAIKNKHYEFARVLMEHDSEMLHWENATGLTALDVLDFAYQREAANMGEALSTRIKGRSMEFIGKPPSRRSKLAEFWAEVRDFCAAHPMKRKLASVLDANELVRRLDARAEQAAKERQEKEEREAREDQESAEVEKKKGEFEFLEDQFLNSAKIDSYEIDEIAEEEKGIKRKRGESE